MTDKPEALRLADDADHLATWLERRGDTTNAKACKAHAAELRRLYAENINQRDWLVEWRKWEAEAGRLQAENEALRANDARYRWLRDKPEASEVVGPDLAFWENCRGVALRGEKADAAIDAAMKEQAK